MYVCCSTLSRRADSSWRGGRTSSPASDVVLLTHEGAALLPDPGRVLGTLPYVRAGVSARLQVFAPRVGDALVGEVTKLGGDYIALLVMGIFPAVIPVKNIREGFQLDPHNEALKALESRCLALSQASGALQKGPSVSCHP